MTYFDKNRFIFCLLIIASIVIGGCKKRITFNPDFYVNDSDARGIISERGELIACEDPRFNDYASMHIEKIKELKKILLNSDLKDEDERRVYRTYNGLLKRMSH